MPFSKLKKLPGIHADFIDKNKLHEAPRGVCVAQQAQRIMSKARCPMFLKEIPDSILALPWSNGGDPRTNKARAKSLYQMYMDHLVSSGGGAWRCSVMPYRMMVTQPVDTCG
jgi:hypothetical protein